LREKGKPRENPVSELLGEDGPIEWRRATATLRQAYFVRDGGKLRDVRDYMAMIVPPADGG
jgi:hypothetical protein